LEEHDMAQADSLVGTDMSRRREEDEDDDEEEKEEQEQEQVQVQVQGRGKPHRNSAALGAMIHADRDMEG